MATFNTEFVADMPGVSTIVMQKVDFGSLEPGQLKRLMNACDRGRVAYSGYVSYLTTLAAKHLGVCVPVKGSPTRWAAGVSFNNLPDKCTSFMFDELMKVADVRQKLQDADNDRHRPTWYHQPKAQFHASPHGSRLSLPAFDLSTAGVEVMKVIDEHVPEYREDMRKLKEFIASKPVFTWETSK